MIKFLLALAFICQVANSLRVHNKNPPPPQTSTTSTIPAFKTFYIDQQLDHFNFRDARTFKQRYLLNDDHFDAQNGPVFFYAGNEGDIEAFWNNTGFVFDVAPIFQALVVFPEHRYYGKTLPFGEDSFKLENIGYLSVEQALADYAVFLADLRKTYSLSNTKNPIIAFGGSYGGMLAAYMRYKYPNLVQGALAASAPIYLIAGLESSTLFFSSVTDDFSKEKDCVPLIKEAFAAMDHLNKIQDYSTLSSKFALCKPINDQAGYNHLLLWMRNAFTIMAMVDYPYPASFLGTLPAWPVSTSCKQLVNQTESGLDILTAFKNFAGVLYNDTSACFDIYEQFIECADPTSCGLGNDALAWDYQACTELNTVQETNGVTDMFPVIEYNEALRQAYCRKTWDVTVRTEWPAISFWGRDIKATSNIVFSNGLLDPWHKGGPLTDVSESIVAVIVEEGAHHLDLRSSNPLDPESVRVARSKEIKEIIKWIAQAKQQSNRS